MNIAKTSLSSKFIGSESAGRLRMESIERPAESHWIAETCAVELFVSVQKYPPTSRNLSPRPCFVRSSLTLSRL